MTVFLVSLGWNGFGLQESFWTVVVLLVGTLIGTLRMLRDRFAPYGLVLIWAMGQFFLGMFPQAGLTGNTQVLFGRLC